ncbi:guanylate kinase [bacterium]|nr:guanylate kinase [bacterium]MCI0566089.1 guanylate kinase [bacterium]
MILIIGPSGSGKSTLIEYIRARFPEIVYPTSCTTRARRDGEKEGDVYHFVGIDEFKERESRGEFLETASYGGHWYGTLKSEIFPALESGKVVLREVEVQGARLIKERIPRERLVIIFIDSGSWEELTKRITNRAKISHEELEKRRRRYEDEISFKESADYIVRNSEGHIEEAKNEIAKIIGTIIG